MNVGGAFLSALFSPVQGGISLASKALVGNNITRAGLGAVVGGIAGASQGYDSTSRIKGFAKGAFVGGVAGGLAGKVPSVLKGAAQVGGATWKVNMALGARSAMKQARLFELGAGGIGPLPKSAMPGKFANLAASPMGRTVKGVGRMITNPAPYLIAGGAVAGGVALLGATQRGATQNLESPTLGGAQVNIRYDQQMMAAQELGQIGVGSIGAAPQMVERFQRATMMDQVGSLARRTPGGRVLADSANGLVQGLHAGRHG